MEQLGLVALVALVAPLGTWLAHPSQLGPLVPSKSSAGQSWQPTVAWARLARGTERFLAVSPAGVEQHLTIPSPKKRAAGTDLGKTESTWIFTALSIP